MASLSVGGNDIDFPGIIFNCIIELRLPFDIDIGITSRPCKEQREITWDLLLNSGLADKIDQTIKMAVERGRKGAAGGGFRLYVAGFPQFFSVETVRIPPLSDVYFDF